MAYRFKLDEPFAAGARRIAREQIDRTLIELGESEIRTSGIHESRKALKRLRALARLIAPVIGEKAFQRRNRSLAKISRLLSSRRDEAVMADTLSMLAGQSDEAARVALAAGSAVIRADVNPARPLDAAVAERVRGLLLKEAKAFSRLQLKAKGFEAIEPGLHDSYRHARRALKTAYGVDTADAFHDLRKTVQWHWRHMSLLSRAWPEAFAVRIAAARELSQILGDDHDLAVLGAAANAADGLGADTKAALDTLIRERQAQLRKAAKPRARRLFAESPKAFTRRMSQYWLTSGKLPSWPLKKPDAAPAARTAVPAENVAPALIQEPLNAAKLPGEAPSQRRA